SKNLSYPIPTKRRLRHSISNPRNSISFASRGRANQQNDGKLGAPIWPLAEHDLADFGETEIGDGSIGIHHDSHVGSVGSLCKRWRVESHGGPKDRPEKCHDTFFVGGIHIRAHQKVKSVWKNAPFTRGSVGSRLKLRYSPLKLA